MAFFEAGGSAEVSNEKGKKTGSSSTKLLLSQEGMDKIIQDVLGSEKGLAALAQGANVSGMFGDSTSTLLAQKLVTDTAGELAKLTAEQVTNKREDFSTQGQKAGAKSGLKTVICTEIMQQGGLSKEAYFHPAAAEHYHSISPQTLRGYHWWANPMVARMKKSPLASKFWKPIVKARYEHVTGTRKNVLGWATIWIAQPICWVIGAFVSKEQNYGHFAR